MPVVNGNIKLSWSQFSIVSSKPAGEADDAHIEEIVSAGAFTWKKPKGENFIQILDVVVSMSMISGKCWVLSGKNTNDLLDHEQGHHDILAIGANEVLNSLKGAHFQNETDFRKNAALLIAAMHLRVAPLNLRYDNQTNHSLNKPQQQSWQTDIFSTKMANDGTLIKLSNLHP